MDNTHIQQLQGEMAMEKSKIVIAFGKWRDRGLTVWQAYELAYAWTRSPVWPYLIDPFHPNDDFT